MVREFEEQAAALAEREFGPSSPPASSGPLQVPAASGSSPPRERLAGGSAAASPESAPTRPPSARACPGAAGDFSDGPPIWRDIARFLRHPHKPCVLAMSRPDAKKNLATLVQAFGENRALSSLANLVLVMGNRDSIDAMGGGAQKVMVGVLKLIDAYDLHGR